MNSDQVNKDYYYDVGFMNTSYFGIPTYKCPLDLWVYQEIMFEVKPEIVIECGTFLGGTTLYLAHLLDNITKGKIISIDVSEEPRPKHKNIVYLLGRSTSEAIVEQVKNLCEGKRTLVILDSDHSYGNVIEELRCYSDLVSVGSYLVVEDTNLNGHPVREDFGPGPMEAVKQFLTENDQYVVDKTKERYVITFYPNGYLKKIK